MKPKELLFKEYINIGGTLFAQMFIRNREEDEIKKSVEANDFIMALLTGENIKEEWKLENSKEYKLMLEYVKIINSL